jgi:putative transposase
MSVEGKWTPRATTLVLEHAGSALTGTQSGQGMTTPISEARLERAQPMLPPGLGYVEGITHDYVRHRTTTLFAALDIHSGAVLTDCKTRHPHREFLTFLRNIEANVPDELAIHLIVDNYGTHKHAKVRAWLAKRPHWHIQFIPTYSSWLNIVERFFALITDKGHPPRLLQQR